MKWKYKLVFDTGEIAFVVAKSREEAINVYCEAKDEEWVRKHDRITNQGLAKSYMEGLVYDGIMRSNKN